MRYMLCSRYAQGAMGAQKMGFPGGSEIFSGDEA